MKKYAQSILANLIVIAGLVFVPLAAPTVGAVNVFDKACPGGSGGSGTGGEGAPAEGEAGGDTGSTGGSGGSSSLCGAATTDSAENIVKNIINMMLLILGMIAVIMIIIGGIRYTTSNGDQNGIKAAKDTILYSVVGLVVAILAFAIVNFVLEAFL